MLVASTGAGGQWQHRLAFRPARSASSASLRKVVPWNGVFMIESRFGEHHSPSACNTSCTRTVWRSHADRSVDLLRANVTVPSEDPGPSQVPLDFVHLT